MAKQSTTSRLRLQEQRDTLAFLLALPDGSIYRGRLCALVLSERANVYRPAGDASQVIVWVDGQGPDVDARYTPAQFVAWCDTWCDIDAKEDH